MTPESPQAQEQPVMRIILYHPDHTIGHRVKDILHAAGLPRITVVGTGRAIIEKIQVAHFDILVTAEHLPDGLDVWRLARMIHSGRFCKHPLSIVLLCPDEDVAILSPRASDHQVRLCSLDELQCLPQALHACLAGNTKPSLLIIEDDPHSAQLARNCLLPMFNLDIASDGTNGLAAYTSRHYDLVLLDLKLPDVPGEHIFHQIRAIDQTQPVVVVTANTSLDSHASLISSGAFDFIVKPFDIGILREACTLALRQRHYALVRAERERAAGAVKALTGKIYAAAHTMSIGKTSAAARHLQSAITTFPAPEITDEEWRALIDEF